MFTLYFDVVVQVTGSNLTSNVFFLYVEALARASLNKYTSLVPQILKGSGEASARPYTVPTPQNIPPFRGGRVSQRTTLGWVITGTINTTAVYLVHKICTLKCGEPTDCCI